MIVHREPRFIRAYQKLPDYIREDFDKKIIIFENNPGDPRLRTHKLGGKLRECFSFYLRDGFRVYFEFLGKSEVDLLYVGPHNGYRRWR
ncbi:type II toxin-antitoxin system RelE/ParE family toxin [Patescibacteria group bacterium]|nr:type II toxin-antitoxin system RelE/ParE family toxin [Patescibacteria group bacterium]MBU4512685.1 type II toxin-antitoxin system RelE/ParE family toxin [Patescibacteria group bacterium]MCG2693587.1 type II toxin-antitoxin system RelE/ParE family toxin [Candidatus Parcubacteria bacterium]